MITPEEAITLVKDKFFELHPRESCLWFDSYTNIGKGPIVDPHDYRIGILVVKKIELRENEYYEEINGKEELVTINPTTQKKEYALNYGFEIFIIFEVSVDLETSDLTIITDRELSTIDSKELRKLR